MKKITTFNQLLDILAGIHIEWTVTEKTKVVRMKEPSLQKEYYCQCPIQAIAVLLGLESWIDVPIPPKLKNHVVDLADSEEYRKEHPEDAELFFMALGLE